MADVLVVAAHPDDELLGVGGTIRRHVAQGDRVHVHLACMDGLRSHQQRTDDAQKVSALLGTGLTFGYLAQLAADPRRAIEDAERLVDIHRPAIIYTHHPGDLNASHRALTEAVAVASRPHSTVRTVRWFETPSSTEWGTGPAFAPSLFVGIDWPAKAEALALYASELRADPHPRSINALGYRAGWWGAVAGMVSAEAFVVAVDRW